jgi:adenylate cyclase
LEKDPNYAAAWAGIASVWNSRLQLHMASREEALPKAKSAAFKALALDDSAVEAHKVQAGILTWADWDFEAAGRAWNRVFEIDPDYALPAFSHYLLNMGRLKEAMEKSKRAVELDPYNIGAQTFYAVVLLHARRYDEALAVARKVLSVQPNAGVALTVLIGSLYMKGMHDDLMAIERERWGKDPELSEALEQAYAEAGYPGTIKRLSDILAARYGEPGSPDAYTLANYFARAGDKERVIEWLEKAYETHDNNMPYIGTNPLFDLVHSDPRFQDLMRRVGLPQ